jgi:hypothetical protein
MAAQDQPAGVEALTSVATRIDSEVGEQTVLGGDSREHAGRVSLVARAAHRFMTREGGDPGVPVERGADLQTRAYRREDPLDHLGIGSGAMTSWGVGVVERLGGGVEATQPALSGGIGDKVEELLGAAQLRERLQGGVAGDQDAGAHHRQRPAGHRP